MTLQTAISSVTATGNGVTTSWPFAFNIPDEDSVEIILTNLTTFNETIVGPTNFSITGLNNEAGGSVTYPLSGAPISSSYVITIRRRVSYTQAVDLENQGAWLPEVVEDGLDRIVMQIQQIVDDTERVTKVPFGSTIDPDDFVIDTDSRLDALEASATANGNFLLASQADAEGESENTKGMSSFRTKQQIDARLASQATAEARTDNYDLMTPLRVKQEIDAYSNFIRDTHLPLTSDRANLFAVRRRLRRGMPDVLDWGFVDGTDCTSKWNQALFDLRTIYTNSWSLFVPAGSYYFDTQQNAIDFGLNLYGEAFSYTSLVARHNGFAMWATGKYGSGGRINDLTFGFSGVSGQAGLYLQGDAMGWAPDFMEIKNINLTSYNGALMTYSLLLDGDARPTPHITTTVSSGASGTVLTLASASYTTNMWANGMLVLRAASGTAAGQTRLITANTATTVTIASAFSGLANGDTVVIEASLWGLRAVKVDNIQAFNASFRSMEFRHMRALQLIGLNSYQGSGSSSELYIRGKDATHPTAGVSLSGFDGGSLLLENALVNGYITQGSLTTIGTNVAGSIQVPKGTPVTNPSSATFSTPGV